MLLSACSSRKNKERLYTDGNELNLASSPKRKKMQTSTPTNKGPCIKIEQSVRHDEWRIIRKDDGAFMMKRSIGNETRASSNAPAVNINGGARTNAVQTGARPKVIVEVPETNNAVNVNAANRAQSVNSLNSGNTGTAKPMNAPRVEVVMPPKNVITLTPKNTGRNNVITINAAPAQPKGLVFMKPMAPEKTVLSANATPAQPKGLVFMKPMAPEKTVLSANATPAQPKGLLVMKETAPEETVVTLNAAHAPNRDVITISATPSPQKGVITINTKPLIKPAVLTINRNIEKPGATNINDSVNTRKYTMPNIWGVPQEGDISVASTSNINSGQSGGKSASISGDKSASISGDKSASISGDKSASDDLISSLLHSDEVYTLQEMFPKVPLNVIADYFKDAGSMESTIDILLALPFEEHVSPSKVPPAASSDDDVVFIQSVKADKPKTDNVPGGKKGGSVIKIELLDNPQVWTINKKDKEGFVLSKKAEDTEEDGKTENQYNRLDSGAHADDSVEVIEEHDPLLDDVLLDGMPHVGNLEPTPMTLVYYQSHDTTNVSNREDMSHDEENLDLTMGVDSFDDSSSPQEKISVEEFEFSDDEENENKETIEYFLFKASLVLRKLRYRNESEIKIQGKSALLNITGSTKNEETEEGADDAEEGVDDTEEMCSDDSDEYYSDEQGAEEED